MGIDVCSSAEVGQSIERFGDRYLNAVYSPDELRYCDTGAAVRDLRLAARFAAKEATIKVLRPNESGVDLRSIEICREANGACLVQLSGNAAKLADAAGIDHIAISMSHEGGLAAAIAVANAATERIPVDVE